MLNIDTLKDEVSIDDLVIELGGKIQESAFTEWKPTYCPFHDDRNASASTNTTLGAFKCHSCDAKGDVISLAKIHLNTQDTREAMTWLQDTFLR